MADSGSAVSNMMSPRLRRTPEVSSKGIYGDRVFKAVLEAQETESGVSLHLVDPEYDSGPVIRQCKVEIRPDDSLETLKARVRAREKEFVVETLAQIAHGQIALSQKAR